MKKCIYLIQGVILLFSSVYSYSESSSILTKQEKKMGSPFNFVTIENLVNEALPIRLMSLSDQKKYKVPGHQNIKHRFYTFNKERRPYHFFEFHTRLTLNYEKKIYIDLDIKKSSDTEEFQKILIGDGDTFSDKGAHVHLYYNNNKLQFNFELSRASERSSTKENFMIHHISEKHIQIKPMPTPYSCDGGVSIKNYAEHDVSFRLMQRSGHDRDKYHPGAHNNIETRKYWHPDRPSNVKKIGWDESITIPKEDRICVSFARNDKGSSARQDFIFDEPSRLGKNKGPSAQFGVTSSGLDIIDKVSQENSRIALKKVNSEHLEIETREYFECEYIQVSNVTEENIPFRLMKKSGDQYSLPGFNNINYPQFWTVEQRSYKDIDMQYHTTTQYIPARKVICINYQLDDFLRAAGYAYFVFGDDRDNKRGAIARIDKYYHDIKVDEESIRSSDGLEPEINIVRLAPKSISLTN